MLEISTMEDEQIPQIVQSEQPQLDKTKFFIPAAIIVAALIISGTIFYTSGGLSNGTANIDNTAPGINQGETVKVSVDDDPFLGPKNAKVVLVEFSDFQCPFCRKFWEETFSQIKKEYIDTGKVKFVYRDFPLDFHPQAKNSAEAAQCANEQGKFWEFHDKIFEEQDKKGEGTIQFTLQDIKKWASEIGVDSNRFNNCLDSEKYKIEVEKDYADGSSYGVSGTPTTFVNGKSIIGAQPYSVLKSEIENALKK